MVRFVEDRSLYWQGRSERIFSLVLDMNRQAGNPIDEHQLEAAVYMHDVGMAFLPLSVLHKEEELAEEEKNCMQTHTLLGAQLLEHMPEWAEAARIVREHHERCDGEGYPNKLTENDICDGAKILAIADTFESMTHERADRVHKRPMLRVIAEINGCKGLQFSETWVRIFNDLIRKRVVKKS